MLVIVDDANKEDEPKLKFDSAGQAIAYISLHQARVLSLQHVRDNRDFYERPCSRWSQHAQDKETPT
ncbi:MAG: hypothetical protein J4N93_13745 [Chloroflexi bacterium]|nr:hypothetical protein [Chloroflexota bacterium]